MILRPLGRLVAILTGAVLMAAAFPAVQAASAEPQQRPNILIQRNSEFDEAQGVRSGSGTATDPYVISGWRVGNLRIQNTSKHVVIRDNIVTGQMILDWIGDRAHVHDNQVADLRVNRNVRRTGRPTSGVISHNTFGVVGQLRHWDGAFENNVVGSADKPRARAVNFDGFNGARFAANTIYGYMDARLHGHHHSSGFGEGSHHHGGAHHASTVDHTHRYHRVSITGNRIFTAANYALAYLDTNHAANDRTAASEQEPALRDPHVHYTRVEIAGNRLEGAGVLVNVFNAPDGGKHIRTAQGEMLLRDNRITLGADDFWSLRDLYGIEVRRAQDLKLVIDGNRIVGQPGSDGFFARFEEGSRDAGIFLHVLDEAGVWVTRNSVSQRTFGVRAEKFTDTVRWVVRDLRTENVDQAVYHDDTAKR